jgi:hypothetical protein
MFKLFATLIVNGETKTELLSTANSNFAMDLLQAKHPGARVMSLLAKKIGRRR